MTKTKQRDNPRFQFLFGGDHYHYYNYKVNAEQAILRQKGSPSPSMHNQSGPMYNRPPPPHMGPGGPRGPGGPGGPGGPRGPGGPNWGGNFRGPPPSNFGRPPGPRMGGPPSMHNENWNEYGDEPMHPDMDHKPRPLMDIPTYAPKHSVESESADASGNENLEQIIKETEEQNKTLKEQIEQSEKNLAAQKKVTDGQVKDLTEITIRKSRFEHLELLSHDTGIGLEEIDSMLQPIVDSCTKETIGSGKVWIFQACSTHDKNRLLSHYLAYKVTEPLASFQLKLHTMYLINDVVHHCVRKNMDDLKGSLESVAVEMFCSTWISCEKDAPDKEPKLTKLIKLWEDKSIFSQVTIRKMREVNENWISCKDQLVIDYEQSIKNATQQLTDTYIKYSGQHDAFVNHAENTIKANETKIEELRERAAAKALEPPPPPPPPAAEPVTRKGSRGSRWDTGSDGQAMPHQTSDFSNLVLPDLSRPPPGFGGPHGPMMRSGGPVWDDERLIPTLPYYDLPAGLMVPLIRFEDSGYKALNPNELRLPPPTHPSDRLIAALEQFYAPPSHDRPRDPEGWEMLGLYEWSRAKTAAIKKKADDIEDGRRQRSATASPEPFGSDQEQDDEYGPPPPKEREKRSYRSRSPRSKSRSRSRSKTRSRSRESTPDDSRGRSRRSPSAEGDYALPSYLTKRSPSPSHASPPRSRETKPSIRRSPTPPETSFKGFGSTKSAPVTQLDSSNKGHQMMQRMGWSGKGLGTTEEGIVEPISGGEVRDRDTQFRGVGHGAPDAFEAFRKSKAGSFYTRMKERDKPNSQPRKSGGGGGGGGSSSFKN